MTELEMREQYQADMREAAGRYERQSSFLLKAFIAAGAIISPLLLAKTLATTMHQASSPNGSIQSPTKPLNVRGCPAGSPLVRDR